MHESYMHRSTELCTMKEELYRNPARTIYGHVTLWDTYTSGWIISFAATRFKCQ
jgi:hypothetical protein